MKNALKIAALALGITAFAACVPKNTFLEKEIGENYVQLSKQGSEYILNLYKPGYNALFGFKLPRAINEEYRFTMNDRDINSIKFTEFSTDAGMMWGERIPLYDNDITQSEKETARKYLEKILK